MKKHPYCAKEIQDEIAAGMCCSESLINNKETQMTPPVCQFAPKPVVPHMTPSKLPVTETYFGKLFGIITTAIVALSLFIPISEMIFVLSQIGNLFSSSNMGVALTSNEVFAVCSRFVVYIAVIVFAIFAIRKYIIAIKLFYDRYTSYNCCKSAIVYFLVANAVYFVGSVIFLILQRIIKSFIYPNILWLTIAFISIAIVSILLLNRFSHIAYNVAKTKINSAIEDISSVSASHAIFIQDAESERH